MYDLSGKTLLVTGASKGIGAELVRKVGAAGGHVIAHYGSDQDGAVEACHSIPESKKLFVQADFEDFREVEQLWDKAQEWRGKIDVLINNAAIMLWDGGFDVPLDIWDSTWKRTFGINVLAPARLLRRAVQHFQDVGGGTIITLSSWAAQKGVTNPDTIAYGSSKAAIHSATQTVARGFAKQNILAYSIAPGVVRTRLSEEFANTQGGEQKITDSLSMGEWVPPEEVAELVAYLATGNVRHLSGATLDINGATYIR